MQLLRFGLVGGAATLTHMAVATALLLAFPTLYAMIANVAAFAVAFFVSFIGHSRYTFGTRGSLRKFFVAALVGLAANNAVLVALLALSSPPVPAVWTATLVSPVVVYLISKRWAFATHD